MKYNLTCDIVCDLLPSFIDELTSTESNIAIKEHLESCDACKSVYNAMLIDTEPNQININERKLLKMTKKKIITIIVSCVLVFAVLFSAGWFAWNWYTTSDFLVADTDYTLTVNKIDIKNISFNDIDGKTSINFSGAESDYVLSADELDFLNNNGYVYQLVVSSEKYSVDDFYADSYGNNGNRYIEVWSNHNSKLSSHTRKTSQLLVFEDLEKVYGANENLKTTKELWSADK